ncbi:MAG TPA: thiol peroxidase [Caldithrix abyssi]|uniref:Thiol peroxidase n=1 Tax=Caldithrix abyssi TaxID=187145 RepID=A0A7V5RN36_CALAY|nr:thiol peroxidase [Caldithrix abyssi]
MAEITLKGNPIHTIGNLPATGDAAPEFTLTGTDLQDISLKDFKGKRVVLNIFPSLDTGVCAASVRRFNAEAEKLENCVVLCISKDTPFAHKRFCVSEGLDNVINLSELRDAHFGKNYGVRIIDGPMSGLLSRAVVIVDENGRVIHSEQVPEIVQEPDYEAALKVLR